MVTRRKLTAVLATSPLLAAIVGAPAWAQPQAPSSEKLLRTALNRLREPKYVRRQLEVLRFYVQLLHMLPSEAKEFTTESAGKTYDLVSSAVKEAQAVFRRPEAGFEEWVAEGI